MQYLYDETGRRYLDVSCSALCMLCLLSNFLVCTMSIFCSACLSSAKCILLCCKSACLQAFAGIVTVSVGHCHPKVVAAVDRQNHLLQHTTNIYLNNEIAEYAQELTAKLPGNLNVSAAFQTASLLLCMSSTMVKAISMQPKCNLSIYCLPLQQRQSLIMLIC